MYFSSCNFVHENVGNYYVNFSSVYRISPERRENTLILFCLKINDLLMLYRILNIRLFSIIVIRFSSIQKTQQKFSHTLKYRKISNMNIQIFQKVQTLLLLFI